MEVVVVVAVGASGENTVIVVVAGGLPREQKSGNDASIVTEYTPEMVYLCEGFCKFDVVPSPKFQLQPVGLFDDVSVN